jgi:hypothetical protein
MATGLGRIARSAFAALPERYEAVRIIFIEGGLETVAVTMYRFALEDALVPGRGSLDELWTHTAFGAPPLAIDQADFKTEANERKLGFAYALRPGLRTTLGRPEQFILYQLWMRVNASLSLGRGLFATGSVGLNISDNFEKIRVGSDSRLPRVRSDIAEYLKEGKQSIQHLKLDYNFNIAPNLYGHVYGGLLEEMFAGVGGEVLYRPFDRNWAIGLDLNWVKQRDFEQLFDLRDYSVVTGHATLSYQFPASIEGKIRAGRYLAKDWGATFELSRTFRSGVVVGAFATFTDVSAAEFGEGRFDKGIYITIPLDLIYVRNVRSGIGIGWRPLIRDGGQQLAIRNPLLGTTAFTTKGVFRRDWRDVLD